MFASNKNQYQTYEQKQCRGEPYVRPYNAFAHRFDIGFCSAGEHKVRPYIGLISVFVRRANTRFAPTFVSEIGWISITTIYPKIYDRLLMMRQFAKPKIKNLLRWVDFQ